MIYITGDTHNTIDMSNLSAKNLRKYCSWQGRDSKSITYAMVLGDFGLPWYDCSVDENGIHPEKKDDQYLLRWYNEKPFKILAVMGNHDNYNMIEKLPEVDMFGKKVLKVSDNIFYLKRGEIYNIEGNIFLVLGGAQSHDKEWRKLNLNLWSQEEWTAEEETACLRCIEDYGTDVDYIVSHTGPIEGISCVESSCDDESCREAFMEDPNVRFNTKIDEMMTYKKWFFGHWHRDWGYNHRSESKYIPLYSAGIVVDERKE